MEEIKKISPEEAIEKYKNLVSSLAFRLYPEAFEDAFQEGMLALCKTCQKFDPLRGIQFSTFLTFQVTGYILNLRGRKKTFPILIEDDECIPERDTFEESIFINDAFSLLSGEEQHLLKSRFVEGKTLDQLGQELGMSHQAVAKREIKAIEHLRKIMKSGE